MQNYFNIAKHSIGKRIEVLLQNLDLSQVEFGRLIEMNSKNISNYILGITIPHYNTLERILIQYRNLNARWLLTGEGEMWESDDSPNPYSNQGPNARAQEPEATYTRTLPQYQVTQVLEPSAAPELEISYLKELLAQKEKTITALTKLVAMHEKKHEK